MAFATKAVATWTVSDVGEYLDQLELTHLKPGDTRMVDQRACA